MMPVVRGAASTRRQILAYSVFLPFLCLAPAFTGLGGVAYAAVAGIGGAVFVVLAVRLAMSTAGEAAAAPVTGDPAREGLYTVKARSKDARNLFAFSIVYLFSLFAALLVEALVQAPALNLLPAGLLR